MIKEKKSTRGTARERERKESRYRQKDGTNRKRMKKEEQ